MLNYCVGKDLSATVKVTDGDTFIMHLAVHGTASAGSVVVKNGINASGVVSFKANTSANSGTQFFSFPIPLKLTDGVYVELTNATATIGYMQ